MQLLRKGLQGICDKSDIEDFDKVICDRENRPRSKVTARTVPEYQVMCDRENRPRSKVTVRTVPEVPPRSKGF